MMRLVIADASETLMQPVCRQLKDKFEIHKCTDGVQVLDAIQKINPHILLLDLHLPQINGLDVLRTIRSSGNSVEVIVTGFLSNDYICNELSQLQVSYFLPKPCNTGAVISRLEDLSLKMQTGELFRQGPERIANHILLNLGFRMGLNRYQCVLQALLLKYYGEDGAITKCLYPKVAKVCGGNVPQVEKAIRDAIKDAWHQGNSKVWQMYFPFFGTEGSCCPSNEVFLARIAYAICESLDTGEKQKINFRNIS